MHLLKSILFVSLISVNIAVASTDLSIVLGEKNVEAGLTVPSGGDGTNQPETLLGKSVRRVMSDRGSYLYVRIKHPEYRKGPVDLYVTAEVFDDTVGRVNVTYDKTSDHPDISTKYTAVDNTYMLLGSGKWRKLTFFMPQMRLGHGQNHGTDLRFAASGVAFHRITVSPNRPDDFDEKIIIDPQALKDVAVTRDPGMELTFGNDASPADAALFKALSVSSVESYVHWAGVEPAKDQWDWSKWDKQVKTLQEADLKWVPFLIAGPAYATPLWFQESEDSHTYVCLEHGKASKVQSLFNPALRAQVKRFLHAFAERYRDTGVIESVLLGVTGIYGESIYPAGPEGGWTALLTGTYHNHIGWWAGDSYAIAAFRKAMKRKYGRISKLNKAWGTDYASHDEVRTFLPTEAPNDRARADFEEWYQQAMTDWSVFWVKSTRKVFPKTAIYLCTGGSGTPMLGADFTAQVAAIAKYDAGVRITNESSNYGRNFALTREVATATRHFGTFCGFEPASKVDAAGVVARIYNATASGARQLHDYTPNTLGRGVESLANFRKNAEWLKPRKPVVRVAVYQSRETWELEPDAVERAVDRVAQLRDAADLDLVTRYSLDNGCLSEYDALLLPESPVLDPKSAKAIEKWVKKGGTLIAATRPGNTLGGRLYDNAEWRSRMFAEAVPAGALYRTVLDGEAPAHWTLQVGSDEDEEWLTGDWNNREKAREWRNEFPAATMRWTGARPGVRLPVRPGTDHTLRLSLSVPGLALGAKGIAVTVNGKPVGSIKKSGRQNCTFSLPASALGNNNVAMLELAVTPWKPSEQKKGNKDARTLGVSVRQVEVFRNGEEKTKPATASLKNVVNREALTPLTRTIGKGKTIFLQEKADDLQVLASVLSDTMPKLPDGRIDGKFATETEDGILWFDAIGVRIYSGTAK